MKEKNVDYIQILLAIMTIAAVLIIPTVNKHSEVVDERSTARVNLENVIKDNKVSSGKDDLKQEYSELVKKSEFASRALIGFIVTTLIAIFGIFVYIFVHLSMKKVNKRVLSYLNRFLGCSGILAIILFYISIYFLISAILSINAANIILGIVAGLTIFSSLITFFRFL